MAQVVAYSYMLFYQVVSVKFSISAGSSAETLGEKGAAQLLAATAFVGTGKRSGIRLVRDLENLGAKFSAVADREQVVSSSTEVILNTTFI